MASRASRPQHNSRTAGSARLRAKQACETCKVRKRKCDGQSPCSYCVRYEYSCSYSSSQHKSGAQSPRKPSSVHGSGQEHMEANSGMAFAHVLGMKFNPSAAPNVHSFSWNLGLRGENVPRLPDISSIISRDDMERLAAVYFARIHPLYSFIDCNTFTEKLELRWQSPGALVDSYDPVFCGVAALGSLYSIAGDPMLESTLIDAAKEMLEATSTMNRPRLHHAAAWLLRTIYLRSAGSPHASWMASCTTMHIVEATGAHQDPDTMSLIYLDTADTSPDKETQRRLFWVATVLNAWISYEYGRARVVLQGVSCKAPVPRKGDITADLIQLYQISELLEPHRVNEVVDLQDSLARVEALAVSHDALVLSQSNLALTIYRRLRLASSSLSSDVLDRTIRLGNRGVEAAVRMAEQRCPWWHVANVPFQFICILLAIDTRDSLSQIGPAMRAFKTVSRCFNTCNMQRAVEIAESLVRLSRLKKEREVGLLKDGLDEDDPAEVAVLGTGCVPLLTDDPTLHLFSGPSEESNLEWDWDAFLNADIPILDFSPT